MWSTRSRAHPSRLNTRWADARPLVVLAALRAAGALVLALVLALSCLVPSVARAEPSNPIPPTTPAPTPGPASHEPRWPGKPVASSQASTQPCAAAVFVGVRGSGEDDGYGPTLTAVRDGLVARWDRTHTGSAGVRQVWLDYPAVAPQTLRAEGMEALLFEDLGRTKYFASTQAGTAELVRFLHDNAKRCPTETVLLAGFSQGASVITHALASSKVDAAKVGAAILVGNPSHYPGQQVTEVGQSVDKDAIGLEALLRYLRYAGANEPNRQSAVDAMIARTFAIQEHRTDARELTAAMATNSVAMPSSLAKRVFSVCKTGDLICDSSAGMARIMTGSATLDQEIDRTRPIHGRYVAGDLVGTLDAAVQGLPTMPNPPQPPAPDRSGPGAPAPGRWPVVVGVVLVVAAGLFAATSLGRRRRRAARQTRSSSSKK